MASSKNFTEVLIGGKVVNPGDIIVGDDGGVIIISPAIAE